MDRLTTYSKETTHENGVCCTHFLGFECIGVGGNCAKNCKWEEAAWSRLAAYEDTGLEPESVEALKLSIMGKAISEIKEFNGLPIARLRELAEADKDGRVVVLPCQSGERVFAILDGEKHVRECEVEHAVLDDWRKVFAIRPVGYAQNAYYAPFGAFGRTVFLTREEAEKALEGMKDV